MKKIEAVIRRTKFDDVKEALLNADIEWFSYYDVRESERPAKEESIEASCMTPVL